MITDAADAEEMKITRKKSLDCTTKHEIEKENKNMRKKKKHQAICYVFICIKSNLNYNATV